MCPAMLTLLRPTAGAFVPETLPAGDNPTGGKGCVIVIGNDWHAAGPAGAQLASHAGNDTYFTTLGAYAGIRASSDQQLSAWGIPDIPSRVIYVDTVVPFVPNASAVLLALRSPAELRQCVDVLSALPPGVPIYSLTGATSAGGEPMAALVNQAFNWDSNGPRRAIYDVFGPQVPSYYPNFMRTLRVASRSSPGNDPAENGVELLQSRGVRVEREPDPARLEAERRTCQLVAVAAALSPRGAGGTTNPALLAKATWRLAKATGLTLTATTVSAAFLGQLLHTFYCAAYPASLGSAEVNALLGRGPPEPDPTLGLLAAAIQSHATSDRFADALLHAISASRTKRPDAVEAALAELGKHDEIDAEARLIRHGPGRNVLTYFPILLEQALTVPAYSASDQPSHFPSRPATRSSVLAIGTIAALKFLIFNGHIDADTPLTAGFFEALFGSFHREAISPDKVFKDWQGRSGAPRTIEGSAIIEEYLKYRSLQFIANAMNSDASHTATESFEELVAAVQGHGRRGKGAGASAY
jgi:hypothetical protein